MAAPETPPGAISDGAKNRFTLMAAIRLPAVRKKKPRRVERQLILTGNDFIFFYHGLRTAPKFDIVANYVFAWFSLASDCQIRCSEPGFVNPGRAKASLASHLSQAYSLETMSKVSLLG
jgi:hypothetical protein